MDSIVELNQMFRASIPQHANYHAMYESLSEPTREIVNALLAGDVTPELIRSVRFATPQEYRRYTFLRALEGGNPNPVAAIQLTNVVLGYVLAGLDEFFEYEDDEEF